MSAEILKALDAVAIHQAEIKERLLQVEQKSSAKADGIIQTKASLGDQFAAKFNDNKELFGKTQNIRLEVKAAADPVTTASGRNLVAGGVGAPGVNMIGLQNGLTITPANGVTAVEYSRFLAVEGSAAVQASEGAAKAALRPTHLMVTQSGITVAGFSKLSRQALSDSGELKRAIDNVLARSVSNAMDAMLVNGGTGFVGGYLALATSVTSLVYQNLVDAVSESVATMQTGGFSPDTVAVSPADWLSVQVLKSTTGEYLSGSYIGQMPSALRGLKVVLSASMPAGKALVFDSSQCELKVVDDYQIEMGYSGTDMTQNLVTLLAETRVIPVYRAVGSAILVTPKA